MAAYITCIMKQAPESVPHSLTFPGSYTTSQHTLHKDAITLTSLGHNTTNNLDAWNRESLILHCTSHLLLHGKSMWDTNCRQWKTMVLLYHCKKEEWRQMLNYPRLPRSVYMQRFETVKQFGLWRGLGIIPTNNRDPNQVVLQIWSDLDSVIILVPDFCWWRYQYHWFNSLCPTTTSDNI